MRRRRRCAAGSSATAARSSASRSTCTRSRIGWPPCSASPTSAGGEGRRRDGRTTPRAGAGPAGIPQPRTLESPRPGGAGRRDPRRLGDHADQRGGARPAERAHHPLLRDQRPGESPRRTGHGRDVLLSSLSPAAVDQAPADGGSDPGGDHQGHAGPDGRRAGATGGTGAGRFAAGAGPAAPQEQGRSAAREIGTGVDRVDGARRDPRPRKRELLAPHSDRTGRRTPHRDRPPPGAARARRPGGRGGGATGACETPPTQHRVRGLTSTRSSHGAARIPDRSRRGGSVAHRGLQRAHRSQEPDAQRLQADRRPAQTPPRSHPQPGERRPGRDGLREVHPGGRDPGPQSGGQGQRDGPRGHQADQPGRKCPVFRPAAPDGGGGAVPAAPGHRQHRPAAGRADVDREPGALRPTAVQRHGYAVQHEAAAVPDEPRRRPRQSATRRPVGDRRPGREGRAAGRSLPQAEDVSDEASLNLFQQQEANRRRTVVLVAGFVAFFAWLGFGGDYIYYLFTRDAPRYAYHHAFPWFGIGLSLAAAAIAWYAYRTGPQKVLWSTGAREIVDPRTDKERQLVNVVEEMAIAAGVPRPRIWIVDDPDPNAFATGTDPLHSHVAVTRGLLDLCTRDELQGVIAHELGHVKNLDVRLMTTLAALVGAVALMHDGASRVFRPGGGSRDEGRKAGPLLLVLLVVWIVSWILAPIIAQLLALGVSRKREYLADAMSAPC